MKFNQTTHSYQQSQLNIPQISTIGQMLLWFGGGVEKRTSNDFLHDWKPDLFYYVVCVSTNQFFSPNDIISIELSTVLNFYIFSNFPYVTIFHAICLIHSFFFENNTEIFLTSKQVLLDSNNFANIFSLSINKQIYF